MTSILFTQPQYLERAEKGLNLRPVRSAFRLWKEHGVWVFHKGHHFERFSRTARSRVPLPDLVKAFLDNSVLIATLCGEHGHHDPSFVLFLQQKSQGGCLLHLECKVFYPTSPN